MRLQKMTFRWIPFFITLIIYLIILFFTESLNSMVSIIAIISSLFTFINLVLNDKIVTLFSLSQHKIDIILTICISVFFISFLFFPLQNKYQHIKSVVASSGLNRSESSKISIDIENDNTTANSVISSDEFDYISPSELKKELRNNEIKEFIPNISENRLENIFLVRKIKTTGNGIEKILALNGSVDNQINELYGKYRETNDPNYKLKLNTDKEYTDWIEEAKAIETETTYKDSNAFTEIVNLREKAYIKGKTRDLALLLARDYNEWANEYNRQDIKQEAFNCYIKSLEYYSDSIKFMNKNETYATGTNINNIAYMIGQVFHSIGDLKNMDKNMRIDAYLMSSSYLNYSSNYKPLLVSYYYNGMVEHKLGIIINDFRYLQAAYNNYCNAFQYSPSKLTNINLNKYIADVNDELMILVDSHGQKDGMLTYEEYQKKRDSALETVKQLESISR